MKRRQSSNRRQGAIEPELFSWPFTDERSDVPEPAPSPARRVHPPVVEAIPGTTPESAVPVSALAEMAKAIFDGAFLPVWVRGEITDFKAHRNGHWYFCLRDDAAQLRCVVWSRDQRGIPAPPDEGMQVVALGQLTFYAARGDVQLTVRQLDAEGDGLWRKAMERTRTRLEADGLLSLDRKRPLPIFPRRIAVITSPDGAALRDIIAVARRRCALVEIVVVPARVQGDGAIDELCYALERVARWGDADVVIIGRGGGGREDLWAFNDERLARAVAACPIPTISAVGHEIDTTICDLVADVRAATPSAAAECAVPVLEELRAGMALLSARLTEAMDDRFQWGRRSIEGAGERLVGGAREAIEARALRLRHAAARLNDLSPLATLARGYAAARDAEGRTLATVNAFRSGEPFELLLRDGLVHATTESVVRDTGTTLDAQIAE
jgi:exodeoxyribonuclease VII large subunit